MTIVALKKQTGFNQDFEFRCLGGKYQDLFFNQVSNRTNSKQEKIRIPCCPKYRTLEKKFPSNVVIFKQNRSHVMMQS